MGDYPVVTIGASAGGVDALRALASTLPAHLPAPIFIVLHLYASYDSQLADLLTKAGPLPAVFARHGQTVEPGIIYLAPPNRHLLLDQPDRITLSAGPRENLHRPAIDALFRTAARTYGPRTIGVILSGTMDDGVAGMLAVRMRGGCTIVQDPADAPYPELPQNVLDQVRDINHVVPLAEIPNLLVHLIAARTAGVESEVKMGMNAAPSAHEAPVAYICPECGGALRESEVDGVVQYICHICHTFGLQTLVNAQAVAVEEALWTALRALREQATLAERIAVRTANSPTGRITPEEYRQQAQQANAHAQVIEELLSALSEKFPTAPLSSSA
jgi:two-component system chemotaxis response regulator CheB